MLEKSLHDQLIGGALFSGRKKTILVKLLMKIEDFTIIALLLMCNLIKEDLIMKKSDH